jgi:hypothetical protein
MPVLLTDDYAYPGGWRPGVDASAASARFARHLEDGGIVRFPGIPFALSDEDISFLLEQRQGASRFHKNISYRPQSGLLKGLEAGADHQRMTTIMATYSRLVTALVRSVLPYGSGLALDFASFRPIEESNRDLPLHRRNDLLHVDSFPTRPARGWRILRVFTNIDPKRPRIWNIGEPFDQLAPRLAPQAGLTSMVTAWGSPLAKTKRMIMRAARRIGAPVTIHSAYDRFMLHFHDYLKENVPYQTQGIRARIEFPARSSWLVYTDAVPHAALAGQFALEHTYWVDPAVMLIPAKMPIRVLESLVPGADLSI